MGMGEVLSAGPDRIIVRDSTASRVRRLSMVSKWRGPSYLVVSASRVFVDSCARILQAGSTGLPLYMLPRKALNSVGECVHNGKRVLEASLCACYCRIRSPSFHDQRCPPLRVRPDLLDALSFLENSFLSQIIRLDFTPRVSTCQIPRRRYLFGVSKYSMYLFSVPVCLVHLNKT